MTQHPVASSIPGSPAPGPAPEAELTPRPASGPVPAAFVDRHVGPRGDETERMLAVLGYDDLDALLDAAVPASIRSARPLDLPPARTEDEVLAALRALAAENVVATPMIGQGYYGTHTPAVIRRNVLESPAWYTSYTPYQAEISQGRLEALLTFQQVVEDLTALPVAGASLLDEATAVAEAIALMWRAARGRPGTVVLDTDLFASSLAVARTRAERIGLPLVIADLSVGLPEVDGDLIGVVVAQVGSSGRIHDVAAVVAAAHERGALVTVAADLLALTVLAAPGDLGADVAVGSAQRFGVPLFGGGPHAAFLAVRSGLERQLPGRLVGVSVDADGAPAYRLALQTREQHIRREKATSNICTAQALLAVVAAMYAVYHGPDGLRAIAERVHAHAASLAASLRAAGVVLEHDEFFDTVRAVVPDRAPEVVARAAARGVTLWSPDEHHVQITCDETTTPAHLADVLAAFTGSAPTSGPPAAAEAGTEGLALSDDARWASPALTRCAPSGSLTARATEPDDARVPLKASRTAARWVGVVVSSQVIWTWFSSGDQRVMPWVAAWATIPWAWAGTWVRTVSKKSSCSTTIPAARRDAASEVAWACTRSAIARRPSGPW